MQGGVVSPGEANRSFTSGCKQKINVFKYMAQCKITHVKLTPTTEIYCSARRGYRICTSKARNIDHILTESMGVLRRVFVNGRGRRSLPRMCKQTGGRDAVNSRGMLSVSTSTI